MICREKAFVVLKLKRIFRIHKTTERPEKLHNKNRKTIKNKKNGLVKSHDMASERKRKRHTIGKMRKRIFVFLMMLKKGEKKETFPSLPSLNCLVLFYYLIKMCAHTFRWFNDPNAENEKAGRCQKCSERNKREKLQQ